MKQLYVTLARMLRRTLSMIGLLAPLDAWASRSRRGHWVRSLLAIYSPADMFRLGVPWWPYAATDAVATFLRSRPGARVLEWGSGSSTLWLSTRVTELHTIEHDRSWCAEVRRAVPDTVDLRLVTPTRAGAVRSAKPGFEGLAFDDYVAAAATVQGDLDLIVIDGRAREACLAVAVTRLAPGGMIVLDNTDRQRYRDAVAVHCRDLSVSTVRGLTPGLPYPTRCTLIRRP